MTSSPVRITLVDDSDLATAGLNALLAPYKDRVVVIDNRHAIAAPDAIDVVLYEPMGQTSMARSLLRDLTELTPAQAAVFTWARPEDFPTANPHLAKTLTASQLVLSLERLAAGRVDVVIPTFQQVVPEKMPALTPAAAAEVATAATAVDPGHTVGLTPREGEIIGLIVGGLSNREISEQLDLSINSVKTYIRSAYRKMGVERRTQAVLWGLAHGMDSDSPAALAG